MLHTFSPPIGIEELKKIKTEQAIKHSASSKSD
jgi:hypothetical protein